MKKLSIEEKAKRYDEALTKARNIVSSINVGLIGKDSFEAVFPELRESENERIRKALIRYFTLNDEHAYNEACGVSYRDIVAWLEKQGEHANFRNKIKIGDKVTRNEDGVLVNLSQLKRVAKKDEKQGEQKSYASETMNGKGDFDNGFTRMMEKEQKHAAWSEENELHIKELENLVKKVWATAEHENDKDTIHKMSDLSFFLKTLKPQLKQKWSEEDETNLRRTEYAVMKFFGGDCSLVSWMRKSLRPQNTWKPSDEQMDALHYVTNFDYGGHKATLVSLYEQLKKLREK